MSDFDSSDEESTVDPTLKKEFNQAANYVQSQSTKSDARRLSSQTMLSFYGLYKVAVQGECTDPKPGLLDQKGRAKWSAWKEVSNLTKPEAMAKYIDTVKEHYGWDPSEAGACASGSKSNSSVMGGNAVSTFAMALMGPDKFGGGGGRGNDENLIFNWVKDNQVEDVEKWLKGGNNPNIQDAEGLTLLHWSVDRGHLELCKLLLEHGSDASMTDLEGETALDYAKTCDHIDIIHLLNDA